jgi:hypothetical protein
LRGIPCVSSDSCGLAEANPVSALCLPLNIYFDVRTSTHYGGTSANAVCQGGADATRLHPLRVADGASDYVARCIRQHPTLDANRLQLLLEVPPAEEVRRNIAISRFPLSSAMRRYSAHAKILRLTFDQLLPLLSRWHRSLPSLRNSLPSRSP